MFGLRFASNLHILEVFKHLSLFYIKIAEHNLTKTPFSYKFISGFSPEILAKNVGHRATRRVRVKVLAISPKKLKGSCGADLRCLVKVP